MNTNQNKTTTSLSIILAMLLASSAHAQSTGTHGGDPNELTEFTGANQEHLSSWYSVKQDLIKGFTEDQYLTLDLKKNDPAEFKSKILGVLNSVQVEFDQNPIRVDGVPRPCENYIEPNNTKHIHCNSTAYAEAMKNYTSETQYKMVAHEYFSVAGFEPNRYGTSDYQFSDQISKSISQVTVKKWAVANNIRLVNTKMEPLQATGRIVFIKGNIAFQLHQALGVLVGSPIDFGYGSRKDRKKHSTAGFEVKRLQCSEVKWSESKYWILHHTGQFECKMNGYWTMSSSELDQSDQFVTGVAATRLATALRAAGFDPEYTFNFGIANLQCSIGFVSNSAEYACGGEILVDPTKGLKDL